MLKRGQVTLFIMVGMLVLLVTGMLIYAKVQTANERMKTENEKVAKISFDVAPIKTYAESCYEQAAIVSLRKIGWQGGRINLSSDFVTRTVGDTSTNISYGLNTSDASAPNKLPSEKEMENELKANVIFELNKCLDLKQFENIGIKITQPDQGSVVSNVSINIEDVSFKIKYPLIIKKGDFETEIADFHVNVPVKLNETLYWANKIVNNITNADSPYNFSDNYAAVFKTNSANQAFGSDKLFLAYYYKIDNNKFIKINHFSPFGLEPGYKFEFAVDADIVK